MRTAIADYFTLVQLPILGKMTAIEQKRHHRQNLHKVAMNTSKKIGMFFWVIITLIPMFGVAWSLIDPTNFRSSQGDIRDFLLPLGLLGPVVFILIQAAQVIITPISHYAIGAIGGYIYGPLWGGLLNYVGRLIGHSASFFIARRAGRPLLEKHVQASIIERYDKIFGEEPKSKMPLQPLILFLIYFLPLFPDDEISYLVGASRMPVRWFFLANLFGHLGGSFSLAYIGSGVDTRDPLFWGLTIVTLAGFPAIWYLTSLSTKADSTHE